jgi:hypothetical protein
MSEQEISTQWIDRCADRLQRRQRVSRDLATELAREAFACMGRDGTCPERVADDMLRMPEA